MINLSFKSHVVEYTRVWTVYKTMRETTTLMMSVSSETVKS